MIKCLLYSRLHFELYGKPVVDFLFTIIELLSLAVSDYRRYKQNAVKVDIFRMGLVALCGRILCLPTFT